MQHNVSIRRILFIAQLVACPGLLWTQVTIKERVEIKPKPPAAKSVVAGTSLDLFLENPNPSQGPNDGAAVIIMRPCSITASGSIQVTPGTFGEYPNTTLSIYVDGVVIASYNKTPNTEVPAYMSQSHTAARGCGYDGALLTSVWSLEGTNATRNVSSSSATIRFEGRLGSFGFVATVTLTGSPDSRYDLASLGVSLDRPSLTVCENTAQIGIVLKDNKGDAFGGNPCSSSITPMFVTVQSASEVVVNCRGQQGKQISVPVGDNTVMVIWNSQGETQNSQATITVSAEGMSKSVAVELLANQQAQGVMIQTNDFVQYQFKTDIIISGLACGTWGPPVPLPNGTQVDVTVIDGTQWGYLRDPLSHRQGTSLKGLSSSGGMVKLEYWAKGEQPQGYQGVQLRASAFGTNTDGWLTVVGNDLRVRPGRSQLAYGDTTKIVIERSDPSNGNYAMIPPNWNTMYEIVEADTAGYLYSVDSMRTGAKIYGRDPEARFYAKDPSSQPDSVNITIRVIAVETWESGGELTQANDGVKPKLRPDSLRRIPANVKGGASGGKKALTMAEEPPDFWSGLPYFGVVKLVVKKKQNALDHFAVLIAPDTVSQTDTTSVFVQAKDINDLDVVIPDETLLEFSLKEGSSISYLLTSDAVLTNIAYGSVKPGAPTRVKLVAAPMPGPPPVISVRPNRSRDHQGGAKLALTTSASDSLNQVVVGVIKLLESNKKGQTTAYIKRKLILIIKDHSPWTIWPNLQNATSIHGAAGYVPKRGFVVALFDGLGKPIVGEEIETEIIYKDSSGGHLHQSLRFKQEDHGSFYRDGKKGNPLWLLTNSDGIAIIDSMVASQVAGEFLVTAHAVKDSTARDTVHLLVKVTNLRRFVVSEKCSLSGSTGQHPDNYYIISQNARDTLLLVASKLASEPWNSSGKMRINEISLIWGGLFDKDTSWSIPHSLHRVGRSVDIENIILRDTIKTFEVNGNQVTKRVKFGDKDWLNKLTLLMRKFRWEFVDEDQTVPNITGRVLYPHFEWKGN